MKKWLIGLTIRALTISLAAAWAPVEPPPPVLSPPETLRAFALAEPGYRIELIASEPMVQDPVAISFDGEGRLWVVEMRGYMQDIDRSGVNDPIGRISVLEDNDGDGVMDRSTVFLDKLVLPRAIGIHPDGVLVAESKALWFAQDTDGDLIADRKTLIDPDYAKDNIEHSANGLLRAMDNWIYSAKEGHRYRHAGENWLREATEERGQWGISQDDRGRLFYNYNHSLLHTDLVPPNTLTRNPNHKPSTGLSVGVTSSNAVFPIRPNRATNRGYIPGALDENGSIKEVTSAGAPFVYRETLFPGFAGDAFVCETAGNLVKRIRLSNSGLHVAGTHAYPDREFIASKDERFRPCWITTGPDGALYVADLYRGIVQDGPHMSPYLREHSIARKMDKPIHLGRIWRVVPNEFTQPQRPSFAGMSAEELVGQLANKNGWWRDQAQLHLVERRLISTLPELREMALTHADPNARLHALWTLEGLRDPEPYRLTAALDDSLPHIRTAALRVLNSLGLPDDELLRQISQRVDATPPQEVALQMILTLGNLEVPAVGRFAAMQKLLLPWVADPLVRDAAMSSLARREPSFLQSLLTAHATDKTHPPGFAFLVESLSQGITHSRDPKAVAQLLADLDAANSDRMKATVFAGITVHRSALLRDPIPLASRPSAADDFPELAQFFAWPGHVPQPTVGAQVKPLTKSEQALFARGRQIFLSTCVACHGADGKGVKFLAPPLAGSDWVNGSSQRLARVLLHGLTGPITVSGKRYAPPEIQAVMPPLAALGNPEIAAVLTYIRRDWGNTGDPVLPPHITNLRIVSQGRTEPWTEQELAPFADDNTVPEKP